MKLSSGKLQFWEWKSTRCCGNIFSLAHVGILHSSMLEDMHGMEEC
jgi:hypothetical protein